MRKFYKLTYTLAFLVSFTSLFAQVTLNGSQKEGLMQSFKAELSQLKQIYNDNAQFTAAFSNYYNTILTADRQTYYALIMQNKLNATQAKAYMAKLSFKYDSMHAMFSSMLAEQPALLNQYSQTQRTKQVLTTCYPNDTNLSFTNGYLNGWNAYSEDNTSTNEFTLTNIMGGLCGSVSKAASTSSNDYQVTVESTLKDNLVPSIPIVPAGAEYSVRLGDSTVPYDHTGMLNQSFLVTTASENFEYQYSLFLENPSLQTVHNYYEKPFYHFAVLDQSGDTIPGESIIISATDLAKQGYDSVYYAPNADYVYYTGWQTATVSLKAYEGQCVTIAFLVSDCSLGAHFGYGYFAFNQFFQPIIPSSPTICGSVPVSLTAPFGSKFLWSGPAGAIISSDTLRTISVNMPGKYSVIVTRGITGAYIYDTLSYTLNAGTRPANIKTTSYYCNAYGGTAIATPYGTPPFTYTWSTGLTTNPISGMVPGTYSFQATDVNGCISVDTFLIATAPAIQIQDSASRRTVEPGDSVLLSAKITGTDSALTYSWAPAASLTNPNSAKAYAHPTSTTVYTVTVTWPCGTLTDTITIFKECTMTASVSTLFHCYDLRTLATAIPAHGVAPFTYKWPYGSSTTQVDSTLSNYGTGTQDMTITDANGCKDSTYFPIFASSKLAINYVSITPISCYGLCNGEMSMSLTGGRTPYTYVWTKGATVGATYIYNVCPGTYSVQVTDANRCMVDTNATFFNPPYYKITAVDSVKLANCTGSSSICVYPSGGSAPYSYNWLYMSNYTSCDYYASAGTYTVLITDHNQCHDSAVFKINGGPIQATINLPNPYLCYGTSETLTANVIGGCGVYKYSWSSTPASTIVNNTADSISVSPTLSTTYYLKVTDTNGCSLTSAVTSYIQVDPQLSVYILGTDTVIPGDSIKLVAIASGGTGVKTNYKYLWEPGGSTADTLKTKVNSTQTYTVTLSDGCTVPNATDTMQVVADTLMHATICGKDPTPLKAPAGASSYVWSGPGIVGASTGQTIHVNMPGTYHVVASTTSGSIISDTIYYIVTSIAPLANITTTAYYCNGPKGTAVAKPAGIQPFIYTWSSGQTTSSVSTLTPGTYNFSSTDSYGCTSVDTFSIASYTIALRDSASSSKVEPGDSVLLAVKAPGIILTYSWAPSASLTHPNYSLTYAHPTTTTTYTVTVTSACGTQIDSVTVYSGCTLTSTVSTKYDCITVGTVLPANGVAPYTYKWFDGGTAQKDSGFTSTGLVDKYIYVTDANGCKDSALLDTYTTAAFALISDTNIAVNCAQTCNGYASPNIAGGTYPYTYLWNFGGTASSYGNLCIGSYTVMVTDAHGCKGQAVEVLKPTDDSIKATESITNGTCTNLGSACVYASGGTPPFAYNTTGNTNNCVTNLPQGKNNVVIIDKLGCRDTVRFNVTGGPVSATISPDSATICYGSVATLTAKATGGAGVYTYQWSAGSSKLNADTTTVINVSPTVTTLYSLKATDTSGCTAATSPTAKVNVDSNISVTITGTDTIVAGNSVTLTAIATGGKGSYTYAWQPGGFTGNSITSILNASRQFTVTVSDGCTIPDGVDSFYVLVDTNFSGLYIDSLINGGCNNSLWVATTGSASLSQFTFLWSTGATTDTISNLCAGTYSVTITDNDPSIIGKRAAKILHIHIIDPAGINEIQNNSLFTIYPVPVSGMLSVSLSSSQFKPIYLSVYDITGRQIVKQNTTFKHNIETLDVSGLANGTYLLILSDGKTTSQAKFTVMH